MPLKNTIKEIVVLEVSEMKTRVLAAAVLLPALLIVILFLPKIVTALLFGVMAAIAAYELLYGTRMVTRPRLVIESMAAAFCVSLWSFFGAQRAYFLVVVLALYGILFLEMMLDREGIPFSQTAVCMAAGLLIPYLLTSLVRIYSGTQGKYLIFTTFVAAFLSDTGAYFTGRALGKHKLAPKISPNKTVEGVVGGIAAAVLGMLLYCAVMHFAFGFRVNYGYALAYGTLGSLGAVFGDLSFSVIKRQAGIKDYGNLIPGHGGILDRFDSMMVVGPMMELLLILMPLAVR